MTERATPRWLDGLWLIFLGGLALIPPVSELHKQVILLIIGISQLLETKFVRLAGKPGPALAVLIKIVLATVLINHTGDPAAINSGYYPIYYLPVMTAALYFGPMGTLLWTLAASLAYSSYLYQANLHFTITANSMSELLMRVLFFFLVAMTVNRFVMQYRVQVRRYQVLSETLTEANRNLKLAQEEARRAERLAALGQLSAGLAHEIRNPLGVIKGSAEMLSRKVAGSEPLVAELAGYISSEVNRLNALVVRFLDFARPSKLELRPENISEIMEHALESATASFPNAKVKVERDYAHGLPEIPVDRQMCEQVFINLITNAFQAMEAKGEGSDGTPERTPEGTLCLSIKREVSNGKPGVCVTVEDSGPGVPPELREQIFNPFFTSKKEGVGLGLSIVAKIVDDHRGTIRLDTDTAKGARFRVFFPQATSS